MNTARRTHPAAKTYAEKTWRVIDNYYFADGRVESVYVDLICDPDTTDLVGHAKFNLGKNRKFIRTTVETLDGRIVADTKDA